MYWSVLSHASYWNISLHSTTILSSSILRFYECSRGEDGLYDYVLVNDDLERTLAELAAIASQALAGVTPDPPGAASAAFRAQQGASTSSTGDIAPSPAVVLGADTPLGERLVALWCSAQLGGRVVAVGEDSRRMERLQMDILQGGMDPQRFLPIVADITKVWTGNHFSWLLGTGSLSVLE